jgi:hypothetical protein
MTGDGVDIVAQPTDLDQLWYKPSSTRLLRAGFGIFVQKSGIRAQMGPMGIMSLACDAVGISRGDNRMSQDTHRKNSGPYEPNPSYQSL